MSIAMGRQRGRETQAAADAELRQGWRAILACFCVAIFAWGFGFYGQAVFVAELHRLRGWPTSTITAATTVYYLSGALLLPFIHQVSRRAGAHVLLIGGVVLLGLGAMGFSNARALWHLFVAGLVLAAGWAACSGPAISTTLARWFDRRRGFAISLALNGASASGFTVAPLLVQATQLVGLRETVIAAVLLGWAIVIPIIIFGTARAPSAPAVAAPPAVAPDPRGVLANWHFWSVALPFALAVAAQVGFIVHMVALLMPLLGAAATSLAVTTSSLAAMLGRLALGAVIDRLPRRATSAISFASQAGGLAILLLAPHSVPLIFAGILLFGLSVGNVITLPAVIVHAEFEAAAFGRVIGLSGAVGQFTLAFAPGAFGVLHDATGNYNGVLLVCIALQSLAAALVLSHGSTANRG